jgi:hypothetical protein
MSAKTKAKKRGADFGGSRKRDNAEGASKKEEAIQMQVRLLIIFPMRLLQSSWKMGMRCWVIFQVKCV